MLNKELLLSLENSDPILMRVGANEFTWARFGYERSHDPFGSINRIPIWYTGGGSLLLSALYYDENRDRTYIRSDSHTKDQVDLTITILGRSTQLSLLGAGANFSTERDPLNLKELWDKTVQVTFDPPQTATSIHNSNEASMEESVDAQQGINDDGECESIGERYYTVSGIKSISSVTGQERRHIRDLLCRRNCRLFQQNCEFKGSCRNKSTSDSFGNPYKRASTESALDTHRSTSKTSIVHRYSRSRSLYRNRNRLVISEEALYA